EPVIHDDLPAGPALSVDALPLDASRPGARVGGDGGGALEGGGHRPELGGELALERPVVVLAGQLGAGEAAGHRGDVLEVGPDRVRVAGNDELLADLHDARRA